MQILWRTKELSVQKREKLPFAWFFSSKKCVKSIKYAVYMKITCVWKWSCEHVKSFLCRIFKLLKVINYTQHYLKILVKKMKNIYKCWHFMQTIYYVPLRKCVQFAARTKMTKMSHFCEHILGISATPQQSWGPSGWILILGLLIYT